jgi:hypothetical protein
MVRTSAGSVIGARYRPLCNVGQMNQPVSAARVAELLGDSLPDPARIPAEAFDLVAATRELVEAVVMTDVDAGTRADAAAELRRNYPEQIIGIEGYTDSDPIAGGQWRNNHELSAARAMAVFDVLVSSGRYRADQLLVVGHGPNRPVVSNATLEGKQRNRRVELVVYPEKRGQ